MNARDLGRANLTTLKRFGLVALAMFGFGFVLIPLYDVFCDLTGLNRDAAQALAIPSLAVVDESLIEPDDWEPLYFAFVAACDPAGPR